MPAPIYTAVTGGAVALAAATPKTVLGWQAHANSGLLLVKFRVSFDGNNPSASPVTVELCYCTWATNAPGTNSASVTPSQESGRAMAVGATAAKNWAAEPTSLTVLEEGSLTPASGYLLYDYPLGTELDAAPNEGFAIRCNAPATVNVRAVMKVSRC